MTLLSHVYKKSRNISSETLFEGEFKFWLLDNAQAMDLAGSFGAEEIDSCRFHRVPIFGGGNGLVHGVGADAAQALAMDVDQVVLDQMVSGHVYVACDGFGANGGVVFGVLALDKVEVVEVEPLLDNGHAQDMRSGGERHVGLYLEEIAIDGFIYFFVAGFGIGLGHGQYVTNILAV